MTYVSENLSTRSVKYNPGLCTSTLTTLIEAVGRETSTEHGPLVNSAPRAPKLYLAHLPAVTGCHSSTAPDRTDEQHTSIDPAEPGAAFRVLGRVVEGCGGGGGRSAALPFAVVARFYATKRKQTSRRQYQNNALCERTETDGHLFTCITEGRSPGSKRSDPD
ncbi:hypothetical protein GWI33_013052 [Rhynchophorus ferrugineus]|uniref:Uncharacterized protein n=1 Tax=Rhynchophorus ferrugineus TaxID=354439 RepID=A0A834I8Z6_RHYFE|nr:hypothetical protein GWI33_013052 [Rhynchophorus ferrugineus]